MGSRKERRKKKETAADDGFAYLCTVCSEFGELLCCERCKEGFHLSCIGLDKCPDTDAWLCSTCMQDKVRCFECKSYGRLQEDMMPCTYRGCSRFYHEECTKRWVRRQRTNFTRGLVCPHHYCDACVGSRRAKHRRSIRCLLCPLAYHEMCLPEGAKLLEDIPGYLICLRHDEDWKYQNQEGEPSRDPTVLFERLPLPTVDHDFQLPHSIQEAVRRLQKRPPSYCHIRRNIYLGKRPKRRQEDESMQCICKPMPGSTQACTKDCLCGMLFTSCSSSCGCGELCTNLPFQKRLSPKMKAVKTEKCGWGLIADEAIKAGDFLVEYVGEVIDDKTCEERLWVMKKQGENNFYMCEISREIVIDATYKGNQSRYINHSCHPNSELQKWQIDGEIRIGVFAISDIHRGEFITYDYQFIQFGTDQQCHCGALDCRGQLGKPMKQPKTSGEATVKALTSHSLPQTLKKSNLRGNFSLQHGFTSLDQVFRRRKTSNCEGGEVAGVMQTLQSRGANCVGLRVRVWWPLDQKFYHGEIVEYDSKAGRHQIRYDDGEKEALCMTKERWEVEKPRGCSQRKRRHFSPCVVDLPCIVKAEVHSGVSGDVMESGAIGDVTSGTARP